MFYQRGIQRTCEHFVKVLTWGSAKAASAIINVSAKRFRFGLKLAVHEFKMQRTESRGIGVR